MEKNELIEKIRIVEVYQNSWAEENLVLLTTLTDKQITNVLNPLIEEERENENGEVIYANEDMASILSEKYPNDIVVLYGEPDYLTI
ncbi:MAG: hypothetical protein WCH21_09860 [Bacteroidota bacterium]